MSEFPPTTLAFDFGTVRVGVAVSRGSLAEPVVVLANDPALWDAIAEVIAQHQPAQLLVGISEAEMALKSSEFAAELEQRFRLPVLLADETLSSYTVNQKMRLLPKHKRSGAIDHYAAAEILQNWLDEA